MVVAGLQIAASHQTFSSQIKHKSGQIKFGQTNFLDIANGNFMEKSLSAHSFSPYHKCCGGIQVHCSDRDI